MVLQVESTYKTKNSNTYSTVAEFVAEHGPLGRDNLDHILEQGTAVLVGDDSMKVTVKYNTEAEYDTHAAVTSGGEYAGKGGDVTRESVVKTEL
tara:strand:- start:57913 stop:58194 length:282 start_codon:yes stop_codon:yes gene_type:complete